MNRFALFLLVFAGCSPAPVEVPTAAPVKKVDLFDRAQDRAIAGDINGAIEDLNEVLSKNPKYIEALTIRGMLYREKKAYAASIADLEKAVVLWPDSLLATNDLAWTLATCPEEKFRDGKRSLQFARMAIESGGSSWEFGDTLAAALAETGEFSEAIRALSIAIEDAPAHERAELKKRLLSYQQEKPSRFRGPKRARQVTQ